MKTREEMLLHYWTVIYEMCNGNVDLMNNCVRWSYNKWEILHDNKSHPEFICPSDEYEFAVAILENKPVFIGDSIWLKNCELYNTVTKYSNKNDINDTYCSWAAPKEPATFMLNDVELPCPATKGYPLTIADEIHYFHSIEEWLQVAEAINELLRNNTK